MINNSIELKSQSMLSKNSETYLTAGSWNSFYVPLSKSGVCISEKENKIYSSKCAKSNENKQQQCNKVAPIPPSSLCYRLMAVS